MKKPMEEPICSEADLKEKREAYPKTVKED
jgi:hypothetical protein